MMMWKNLEITHVTNQIFIFPSRFGLDGVSYVRISLYQTGVYGHNEYSLEKCLGKFKNSLIN